jgi:hypothetical protein
MAYSSRTDFYRIPIPLTGDIITGVDQQKTFNIIENQLLAGMKGLRTAVFAEGVYSVIDNGDSTYKVMLSSNGSPAISGIVNGGLIETDTSIIWNGLSSGLIYYLYLVWKDETYQNPSDFTITSNTYLIEDDTYLFIATLDLTDSSPVLNTSPTGKFYSWDMKDHIFDNDNPHGTTWIQDNLTIRKGLDISISDSSISGAVISIDDTRTTAYPEIESTGSLILKNAWSEVALSDESNPTFDTTNQTIIGAVNESIGSISSHIADTSNPHSVTLSQLGVTSTPTQVNDATVKSHIQGTDTVLDNGGSNQVSASEIRTHLDDIDIHREINDSATTTTNLWSASKINSELQNIDVQSKISGGSLGVLVTVSGATNIEFANITRRNITDIDIVQVERDAGDLSTAIITTDGAHGWTSLDVVSITNVPVGSGVSGSYTITVTDYNKFSVSQVGSAGTWVGGESEKTSGSTPADLGSVSIGYYGYDNNVSSSNQFMVYNSGGNWKPIKVMAKYS